MRIARPCVAVVGWLLACSAASADEGLWLFSHPPRQQLRARYAFEPSAAWLERLQKATVLVDDNGSGAFVSPDGLMLTNRHVGLRWLRALSEKDANLVKDGYCADRRDRELRCDGLELCVLWSVHDVTARVHAAIKPGLSLAEAAQARREVLYRIEAESSWSPFGWGLANEIVSFDHGAYYHLYRYKKYTDVRLVFVPDAATGKMLDVCFFRAYEYQRPAKTPHFLPCRPTPPERDELALVAGCPGTSSRFCTVDDLEMRQGQSQFLRHKWLNRLSEAGLRFGKAHPESAGLVSYELDGVEISLNRLRQTLRWQEKILAERRTAECLCQVRLGLTDPDQARTRQQAVERIAACVRNRAELSQSYFFLESGQAFYGSLFQYARGLLRLADETAKPNRERLREYMGIDQEEAEQGLLVPWPVVKELEAVQLASALELWSQHAGLDRELVAKVLDGKTPQRRARELIAGTKLDQVAVRKELLKGGRAALARSPDSMLALARLVDDRARQVRREWEETVTEPCCQAYAVLARSREQPGSGNWYPDATTTLRLAFGKVSLDFEREWATRYGDLLLADVPYASRAPKSLWKANKDIDFETLLLFRCSADVLPGNSGGPVVDRQGQLIGVVAWGHGSAPWLAYRAEDWGCGTVAVQGLLAVLDHVYHADTLVKELGGNPPPTRVLATPVPPSPPVEAPAVPQFADTPRATRVLAAPAPPAFQEPFVPQPSTEPWATRAASAPANTSILPPSPVPTNPVPDTTPDPTTAKLPWQTPGGFSINPVPSTEALLRTHQELKPSPDVASTTAPPNPAPVPALTLAQRHKELAPALIKALQDRDVEVRQSAEAALDQLGYEAVPALLAALRQRAPATPELPRKDYADSAANANNLKSNVPNEVAALIRALDDQDVAVRRRAVHALTALVRAERPPPVRP